MKEDPIWERQHLNELNGNQNLCDSDGGYQTETPSDWWCWPPGERHLSIPGIRWEEAGSSWHLQTSFAGSRKREAPRRTLLSLQVSRDQVTDKTVLLPWLCLGPNFRPTKAFQVTLFSCPLNPLLVCYVAGKNGSSAGLLQWGGVRGPILLRQALFK